MNKVKINDYKDMKDDVNFKHMVDRVLKIDSIGQIHGTWSGFAIISEVDNYEILPTSRYELFKLAKVNKSKLYGINFLVDYYINILNWNEEKAINYTIDLFKNRTIKEIEILGCKN